MVVWSGFNRMLKQLMQEGSAYIKYTSWPNAQ